jgi:hypothetical protein
MLLGKIQDRKLMSEIYRQFYEKVARYDPTHPEWLTQQDREGKTKLHTAVIDQDRYVALPALAASPPEQPRQLSGPGPTPRRNCTR